MATTSAGSHSCTGGDGDTTESPTSHIRFPEVPRSAKKQTGLTGAAGLRSQQMSAAGGLGLEPPSASVRLPMQRCSSALQPYRINGRLRRVRRCPGSVRLPVLVPPILLQHSDGAGAEACAMHNNIGELVWGTSPAWLSAATSVVSVACSANSAAYLECYGQAVCLAGLHLRAGGRCGLAK